MNRLKSVMNDKGVSRDELAEKVGVTKFQISRICVNKSQPTVKLLFKLAHVLDCEPSEIIRPKADVDMDQLMNEGKDESTGS